MLLRYLTGGFHRTVMLTDYIEKNVVNLGLRLVLDAISISSTDQEFPHIQLSVSISSSDEGIRLTGVQQQESLICRLASASTFRRSKITEGQRLSHSSLVLYSLSNVILQFEHVILKFELYWLRGT